MGSLSFRDSTVVFATNHGKARAASELFTRVLNTTSKPKFGSCGSQNGASG